jgi:hypothetical protein
VLDHVVDDTGHGLDADMRMTINHTRRGRSGAYVSGFKTDKPGVYAGPLSNVHA